MSAHRHLCVECSRYFSCSNAYECHLDAKSLCRACMDKYVKGLKSPDDLPPTETEEQRLGQRLARAKRYAREKERANV